MKINEANGDGPNGSSGLGVGAPVDHVYECCWENCDWQFEDATDCIDHCIAEVTGHVQSTFTNAAPG